MSLSSEEEGTQGHEEMEAPRHASDTASDNTVTMTEEQEVLSKVLHLKEALETCEAQLEQVSQLASSSVAAHPSYQRMRDSIQQKISTLRSQLREALIQYQNTGEEAGERGGERDTGAEVAEGGSEVARTELTPMLADTLDKLWERPYDCQLFVLQLLQSLAELDDRSLCMMSSCFARYLENHSVPIE